jgi:hypothetical protein
VAISSNLHPAGFDERMPKTLATATVAVDTQSPAGYASSRYRSWMYPAKWMAGDVASEVDRPLV